MKEPTEVDNTNARAASDQGHGKPLTGKNEKEEKHKVKIDNAKGMQLNKERVSGAELNKSSEKKNPAEDGDGTGDEDEDDDVDMEQTEEVQNPDDLLNLNVTAHNTSVRETDIV